MDVVYAFIGQLVIVSAGLIGQGFILHDSSYIITGYLTALLMTFILLGILQMYTMLSNPVSTQYILYFSVVSLFSDSLLRIAAGR